MLMSSVLSMASSYDDRLKYSNKVALLIHNVLDIKNQALLLVPQKIHLLRN